MRKFVLKEQTLHENELTHARTQLRTWYVFVSFISANDVYNAHQLTKLGIGMKANEQRRSKKKQ